MRADLSNHLSEDAVVARLDPARVQQYARATGWEQESRLGKGRVAVFQRPESRLDQIRIPLTHDLTDFAVLMADALTAIAKWENRPAVQLLHELLLPPADVLRFSESGPAADAGNLPFGHGLELLTGVRKTLLATACSVTRPQAFHPRLSLGEAEQFLNQCWLGQTERGSFTVTVACPLDAVPGVETLFDATPFGRRVTTLLMRSLQQVSRAVELGEAEAVLAPAEGEPVVSANLCEGLLDMTPEGECSSLAISVRWAKTLSPAANVGLPQTVQLRHDSFSRIETLAGRLRPARTPQRQALVGFVDTLDGRPNFEGRREGPVILHVATPEGAILRVRAELDANDYQTAWQAHGRNLAISLQGILRLGGRLHRIDEVLDFRLLQQTPVPHMVET